MTQFNKRKLRKFIKIGKTNLDKLSHNNVVYKIQCKDCPTVCESNEKTIENPHKRANIRAML